jgi:transposase
MEYVGIDLHKKESQICLLTEAGEVMECRIRTEPQRFAAVLGGRPRARILVEASTESEWVARCLEALGHEVVAADPNFALIPPYGRGMSRGEPGRCDRESTSRACGVRSSAWRSRTEASAATQARAMPGRHRTRAHRSVAGLRLAEARTRRHPVSTDRYGEPTDVGTARGGWPGGQPGVPP